MITIIFLIYILFPHYILSSSIEISRRNKHINLYHPDTNELIISSPINNERFSLQHIHTIINKNYNNKNEYLNFYQNNNNNNNNNNNIEDGNNSLINNSKLQINSNNNNKIYSHLKLKNDYDYKNNNSYLFKEPISSSSILYGGITSSFEYFIPILVGTPPQMFTVQVDTGSTSLAVPGSNCYLYKSQTIKTSCSCSDGNLDGLYNFEDSISGIALNCSASVCNNSCQNKNHDNCPFMLKYGDGSFIAGSLVIDNVTIGQFTVPAKFGNIQKESLSFSQLTCPSNARSQAVRDGILGFNGDDIFSRIVNSYGIPNVFSMCLGKDGGILTIGGINERVNIEPPKYTPIIDFHYYSIHVLNIYVENESLKFTPNDFISSIVDSGTTLLYFNDEIFYSIIKNLEQSYSKLPGIGEDKFWEGNCHYLSEESVEQYPTIYLELGQSGGGSFKLAIPPSLYFLKINNLHCFGISHMKEISVLIGDVVLQGYNVIYDRGNSKIGFAKIENCKTSYSDNSPLQLSIVNGNYQKATEENQFRHPLVLSLKTNKNVIISINSNSTDNNSNTNRLNKTKEIYSNNNNSNDSEEDEPIGGVIIGFSIVSGNAYFYPSYMTSIRNITDADGLVSVLVVPRFFGKIVVEAMVWGNNNTNIVYFTLHSNMKPWKIIIISLSVFGCSILLLLVGFLIYKKKISRSSKNNSNNNNKNNNKTNLNDLEVNIDNEGVESLLFNNENSNNNNINNNNGVDLENNIDNEDEGLLKNKNSTINNNNKNNNNNDGSSNFKNNDKNNENLKSGKEWDLFSDSLIKSLNSDVNK
ncbi:hypothetical protein ACTFIV_005925 [Dictyostelium citrinum]